MKRRVLFGAIVVLLITNIATLLLWKQDQKETLASEQGGLNQTNIVASVGDIEIKYDQWMSKLRENHGKEQLRNLVNRSVVRQLAEEKNIKISEKVIAREIALLTTMAGVLSEKETKQKEKEWREDILYRYRLGALLAAGTSVAESEIRSYYEEYKDQYNFQASMQLSHIVVPDKETAKKVIKELDKGASFQLLAEEYSIDEETKDKGGYLGFFVNTSQFLPEEYREIALDLKERRYSEPFRGNKGITILYLHRKLDSVMLDYKEAKPYIKRELALEKLNQNLTAEPLWEQMNIEWIYE